MLSAVHAGLRRLALSQNTSVDHIMSLRGDMSQCEPGAVTLDNKWDSPQSPVPVLMGPLCLPLEL